MFIGEEYDKIEQEQQPHFSQPGTLEWEFSIELRKALLRIRAENFALKGIHKNELKQICNKHIKLLSQYKQKIAELKQIIEPHK